MAYIIDSYNKYDSWDRSHAIYKFNINKNDYAVKEIELCWGMPMLEYRVDREEYPQSYYIYESRDEAIAFAKMLYKLNLR